MIETRVLVAYEDEYPAYRGVIASGIALLRPHVDVATCTPDELLGGELERFEPQVVVCGRPGTVDPGDRPAWVELPIEPQRPAKVRVGGRQRESTHHLSLEGLLAIIDEAEELIRKNTHRTDNWWSLGRVRSNNPSGSQRGPSPKPDDPSTTPPLVGAEQDSPVHPAP